jgi:hypothetical protein
MPALAAIALSAAGCGESSHSRSATAASTSAPATTATVATPPPGAIKLASGRPLTRAEWIAKGEAICTRTNTKVSATTVPSEREYPRVLPQLAVYEWTEARELSKLVPPRPKTHDWAQIVSNLQLDGNYLSSLTNYFQAKNRRAAYSLLVTAERLHERLGAIARHDGFNECTHIRVRRG